MSVASVHSHNMFVWIQSKSSGKTKYWKCWWQKESKALCLTPVTVEEMRTNSSDCLCHGQTDGGTSRQRKKMKDFQWVRNHSRRKYSHYFPHCVPVAFKPASNHKHSPGTWRRGHCDYHSLPHTPRVSLSSNTFYLFRRGSPERTVTLDLYLKWNMSRIVAATCHWPYHCCHSQLN